MTLSQDIMESRAKIAEFRIWNYKKKRMELIKHRQPSAQAKLDGFIQQAVAEKHAVDRVTDELVEGVA